MKQTIRVILSVNYKYKLGSYAPAQTGISSDVTNYLSVWSTLNTYIKILNEHVIGKLVCNKDF